VKALLLVGSPKGRKSASHSLGDYLMEKLRERGAEIETLVVRSAVRSEEKRAALLDALEGAELVVLSAPLYIDGPPAAVIRAMELVADRRPNGEGPRPRFVVISNAGFPEAEQNDPAVAIYHCFADAVGWEFAGALKMGGGPMFMDKPLEEVGWLARHARAALDLTAAALAEGEPVPEEAKARLTRRMLPDRLFTMLGTLGWRMQARRHDVQDQLDATPYAKE
jgi:hypothetical protein